MIRARGGETDGAILPPAPNRSSDVLMPILSNPRHERFAQELANGVSVQATAKAIEKTALTKEWVIERLMLFAKCADKDAASVRALELLGKELGMFVDRHADVSALYAISDKPMTLEEWAEKYTGQPLPQ